MDFIASAVVVAANLQALMVDRNKSCSNAAKPNMIAGSANFAFAACADHVSRAVQIGTQE